MYSISTPIRQDRAALIQAGIPAITTFLPVLFEEEQLSRLQLLYLVGVSSALGYVPWNYGLRFMDASWDLHISFCIYKSPIYYFTPATSRSYRSLPP